MSVSAEDHRDGDATGPIWSPPVATRRHSVHEAHGVQRPDDYAWLRDTSDPEVLAVLRAERAFYDEQTARLAGLRAELGAEMEARTPPHAPGVPFRRSGRQWVWRTRPGDEHEHLVLLASTGDVVVLDPNDLLGPGGHVDLGVVEPGPDARLLAYSVDVTGDEVYELRFRDLATGRDLPDRVPRSYYGGAWNADGTAFHYTVHDEQFRPDRVVRHVLGTPVEDDVVVVAEPDRRFTLDVRASRDGHWVLVTSASRDTTEVTLLDATDAAVPPRVVAARRPGVEYSVEVLPGGWFGTGDDRLLLVTDDGAPEFRLVEAALPRPGESGDPAGWVTVPGAVQRGGGERLVDAAVLVGHVVLSVRRDAEPFLRVLSRAVAPGTNPAREIHPHVPCGSLRVDHLDDPRARDVVVVEENLVTAPVWSRVDLDTGERVVLHRTPVPGADPTRYVTERVWATADDGARVPVTIARRRDALPRATNGALLYGYGAYESCAWPEFSVATLSLLDRDVCYAVAHVRGGGEMGRGWWQAGRLRNKARTFDDFVAARAGLLESGWAVAGEVVTRGLSAGGLLQAAAWSRAPQLWRGVVAEVPFVDVVTTMSDDTIPLTVNEWDEWGNPADPEDFAAMLSWSPYDNVPPSPRPPLLVTGALHDPRVLVHEPAKWVARIRATDDPQAPTDLLFRVELGEGAHAGPTGRFARLHYEAEILSWVLDRLGVGPRA